MEHWKVDGYRRRLDAGEALALDEQRELLGSLVLLQRAARLPDEFHVRVQRDSDASRWSAHHPLLRVTATADHPSDALVRAAVELRRVLRQEFEWPARSADHDPDGDADDVDAAGEVPESTWEALSRTDPAPETVAALAAALRALGEVRDEARGLRYGRSAHLLTQDPEATPEQRRSARAELRRGHARTLAAAGVEAADEDWRDDGFGPPERFGIGLPVLVVGVVEDTRRWEDDVPRSDRRWPWGAPRRFPPGRWVALEHSWSDDDHWAGDPRHLRLIAQPLAVTPEAELALRRLAETVRPGDDVRAHAAFHEAATRLLPRASVSGVRGWVGPTALPLDIASIDHVAADPPDLTGGDVWTSRFRLWWLSDPSGERRF